MDRHRKNFSKSDYQNNNRAFEFLKRDLSQYTGLHGQPYFPVLRPEDYNIDVAIYKNEAEYKCGTLPLCFIELEVKSEKAASGWTPNHYPYPDIHFLFRKESLLYQPAVPFWVCYNHNGTDCVTLPLEIVSAFPIAQNYSSYQDLVNIIPIEVCSFGRDNIMRTIENYYAEQLGLSKEKISKYLEFYFHSVNRSFRKRLAYDKGKKAHQELVRMQKTNQTPVGIRQFI